MHPVGGHANAERQEENKPRSLNDAPSHFTPERLRVGFDLLYYGVDFRDDGLRIHGLLLQRI